VNPAASGTPGRVVDASLWVLSGVMTGALVVLSVLAQPPSRAPGRSISSCTRPPTLPRPSSSCWRVWRPGRGPGPLPRGAVWIAGGLGLLGICLELIQGLELAPGREGDPLDALANGVGVTIGAAAWAFWRHSATVEAGGKGIGQISGDFRPCLSLALLRLLTTR
jgi:hypothetical protein